MDREECTRLFEDPCVLPAVPQYNIRPLVLESSLKSHRGLTFASLKSKRHIFFEELLGHQKGSMGSQTLTCPGPPKGRPPPRSRNTASQFLEVSESM